MSSRKASRKASRRSLSWAWIGAAVIVVVGLGIGALVWRQVGTANSGKSPMSATVSVPEAARLRDAGAFVLDVREPAEWASFHLAGATLIPLGSLSSRLNEVPRDKPVVVVCRTGHRSLQGRDILLQAGFTQVTTMTGGLTAWQDQGLPTVSGP
jgi:rhodanese-related sulfurtransferase